MDWNDVTTNPPPIGVEVMIRTIYDFDDVGVWDGTQWLNKQGEFAGVPEEAPLWKLKNK